MATLVAIGYPDEGTAEEARQTVGQLEADLIIQADEVAAIRRDTDGKYHVHTSHSGTSTAGGAVWGGFWGLLFGLLFFIPFAGWAVGAGLGALFGHLGEKGIDKAIPGSGPRSGEARHVGAVHDHREGDPGQGRCRPGAVRRHRHQDLPLGRGHQEAAGGPPAAGRRGHSRLRVESIHGCRHVGAAAGAGRHGLWLPRIAQLTPGNGVPRWTR